VRIARGARSVEDALVSELIGAGEIARAEPSLLRKPIRVVVPSHSLRDHLIDRLVASAQRPLIGVRVQTLLSTAIEIRRNAEAPQAHGGDLFSIFVERAARTSEPLQVALGDLQRGYQVAAASVSDLLDAGLESAHADALDERLTALGSGAQIDRARHIVRIALATEAAMQQADAFRASDLLRDAARRLEQTGAELLPSRLVFVHGFAEATGNASDLLTALARVCQSLTWIDHPPDPAHPLADDRGIPFTDRLRERLTAIADFHVLPQRAEPPEIALVSSPGAQAECREIALRVRRLLSQGARPEGIAIVARALEPFRLPLRTQLRRAAVPFSSCGAPGPLSATGRKLRVLAELLARVDEMALDPWLELTGASRDVSLALHSLGVGSLGELAQLDVSAALMGAAFLPLPIRRGGGDADIDTTRDERPRRPRVSAATLRAAASTAREFLDLHARWQGATQISRHLAHLRDLTRTVLRWPETLLEPVRQLTAELASSLPDVRLERSEFVSLLVRSLAEASLDRFGGAGGGIQVLDVTEARARSFEHLFLIGLNRDQFPRSIREDSLLPDALRLPLREVLPELPIKGHGHSEESYLFAELCSASPHVTLSWQSCDDDGRSLAVSPFVARMRLARSDLSEAQPSFGAERSDTEPTPALAHAIDAGTAGIEFEDTLAIALADPELARVRVSVLRERDAPQSGREAGPYQGFIGAAPHEPLFVTALENYSRCPWQAFLRRVLRLEPVPDALEALPSIDARTTGILVHRVLDRIVTARAREATLAELAVEAPELSSWPEPPALEALLEDTAAEVLRDEGIRFAAMRPLLVEAARPFVNAARARIWPDSGPLEVLGSEIPGTLRVDDRELRFRADLVERLRAGLQLTDFKTGRPFSTAVRPAKRAEHFAAQVAAGRALQGYVYQAAAGKGASGRYAFLGPAILDDASVFEIAHDDEKLIAAGRRALSTLLNGWHAASFFPRLVDPERGREPRACSYCEMSQACTRGDARASESLSAWIDFPGDAPPEHAPALDAARAVFELWLPEP